MEIYHLCRKLKKDGILRLIKRILISKVLGYNDTQSEALLEHGCTAGKHTYFTPDGNVVWLNPSDIECFWTAGKAPGTCPGKETRHLVRTKSGQNFILSEESWLKVLYGVNYDPNNPSK